MSSSSNKRFSSKRVFRFPWSWSNGAALLGGFVLTLVSSPLWQRQASAHAPILASVPPTTNAWGRLIVQDLFLEQPSILQPDGAQALEETRWHFTNHSPVTLRGFLDTCDLSTAQKERLLQPGRLETRADGCWLSPEPEAILNLGAAARAQIYSELEKSPANLLQRNPFPVRLDRGASWFSRVGLTEAKIALLQRLTYPRGAALCFCDTPAARHFLNPEEFQALLRALYSAKASHVRLRLQPGDPVEQITAYWSQGAAYRGEIVTLLKSAARHPGGVEIDVEELLPSLPRGWLYQFPGGLPEPAARGDCFWSSLNFFNRVPTTNLLDPQSVAAEFRRAYSPIPEARQLGDVIVFADSKGSTLHACVHIAGNIVFTKNGARPTHPWVLMSIEEVRAIYTPAQGGRELAFRRRAA